MCGRFTLIKPGALRAAFPRLKFPEFSETGLPRYNIAPTQDVLGVRNDGRDTVEALRWGVRGRINIRAESVLARRNPIRRRCIEFADGFYEWRDRRPFYYTLRSGEPFALAGTWEPFDGSAVCDVVTCDPNALVAPVHDRMPVMLTGSQVDLWLDPEPLPPEVAASILRPFDAGLMAAREVSRRVNNANYDAPDVLETSDDPRLL
ncbi:MAG TPA: SOS response-associated peptidase [Candidatus Cybelea sp.]|jgi:putative SOS response-associated peptidase YedK|nr:SOS response-associated peptidase [Candidatus Cybelea sp.]